MTALSQLQRLHALRIVLNNPQTEAAASADMLFASRAGAALVNAAFDLFECDELYDLARDIEREVRADARRGAAA